LIKGMKSPGRGCALAMDCAYEGNETRALVRKLGYKAVVPPNLKRRKPWKLDRPSLQTAQRGRAALSQAQRLSQALHTLRQT